MSPVMMIFRQNLLCGATGVVRCMHGLKFSAVKSTAPLAMLASEAAD